MTFVYRLRGDRGRVAARGGRCCRSGCRASSPTWRPRRRARWPRATPPASQRDAEYAALARDVESLDREFGLVKRVVKLVTPAVVHIEAKPLPQVSRAC